MQPQFIAGMNLEKSRGAFPTRTRKRASRGEATHKASIWIDLENSPHVPFFVPIVDELDRRGYTVLLTGRDCFQVRELTDLFRLNCRLVSHHPGKGNLRKMAGLCFRAFHLASLMRKQKPSLAVSHGSRSQLLACALLRVPCIFLRDYEFSTPLPFLQPSWLICPEMIPSDDLQCDARRILKYPGIKEDVYARDFTPDSSIRGELGLSDDDVVAVLRPPASEAHYHNREADALFDAAVKHLSASPRVKSVLLPRNERQSAELRIRWSSLLEDGRICIPPRAVDGLNLIWHSDLVISGGGTMNREAAALGVPVYSVFRGRIGAVDRYLARHGRLTLLESTEDVQAKVVVKRRTRPTERHRGNDGALHTITAHIVSIVETGRPLQVENDAAASKIDRPTRSNAVRMPQERVRTGSSPDRARLETTALRLLDYCDASGWAGYDPYDGLNSKLFAAVPFLDFRFPRLAFMQLLKKSPVNLRPLLLVPKTQNPKAIALFLSACLNLSKCGIARPRRIVEHMIERLIALRSPGFPSSCWGYSFPWQTRTVAVPAHAPNLVCTVFVAGALLDAYEQCADARLLKMAASTANYILHELYWTEGDSAAGFSYPVPNLHNQVHNANLLGAALLARVHKHTGDSRLLDAALRVARYAVANQRPDGSWPYGESRSQRWIDNFHTGYNLCALQSIGEDGRTGEFQPYVKRGFDFYRAHFFREDGAPSYFHDRAHPVDIHSVAQSIITLLRLRDLHPGNSRLASTVFDWAMKHMWDERGYFYYRVFPWFTNKISYMRWSQAWMLLAISTLLTEAASASQGSEARESAALTQAC